MNGADRLSRALMLAAVVVAMLVYAPVHQHGFIVLDDRDYVIDNPQVQRGLTWSKVVWAFTTGYASNWHPLTWLSHLLDVELFGIDASGPHIVNLLLHLATASVLFVGLRRMTNAPLASAAVAALFLIHPLRVESVAWIAERKDVLSGFFFVLTLWAWAKYVCSSRRQEAGRVDVRQSSLLSSAATESRSAIAWYASSLAFFALGLMSKPMLVTLPCVLLLLDYWPLGRVRMGKFSWPILREKLPFFALSLVSCVITLIVQHQGGAVQSTERFALAERFGNAAIAYTRYLGKTFWPADLAVFYPHPGAWPIAQVLLAALLIAGLCAIALVLARRSPFIAVGWFWFLGMLVPVIGLVQVGGQALADRYTYLPSIGFLIALVWSVRAVVQRARDSRVAIGLTATAAALLFVAGALTTRAQVRHWRDDERLFRHAIAVTERNYIAHHSLGYAHFLQGRIDEAIAEFSRSLELRPDFAEAHLSLGNALLAHGRTDDALASFRRALEAQPAHPFAHYNLGTALLQVSRPAEALPHLEQAVQGRPDDFLMQLNLGNAHLALGHAGLAIEAYRRARVIDPTRADASSNLGSALLQRGRVDEAITAFRDAVALEPRHANAHFNLGDVYLRNGRFDRAIAHLRACLDAQPDDAEAHDRLASALTQTGDSNEAAAHADRAREIRKAAVSRPTQSAQR